MPSFLDRRSAPRRVALLTLLAASALACGGDSTSSAGGAVASVTLDASTLTMVSGEKKVVTATLLDGNHATVSNRTVSWSSSQPQIAAVTSTGPATAQITGVLLGTSTITATIDSKTATVIVTVATPPVETVKLAPAGPGLLVGSSVHLTPTLTDATGRTLTGRTIDWTSSNSSIVSVDGTGLVVGRGAGIASVTATSEGKSAQVTFNVGTVRSIVAGPRQSCLLTNTGAAWCWGFGGSGALGTGNTTSSTTPVAVSGGLSFGSITMGNDFVCGLSSGGKVYCWGNNENGALGDGTTTNRSVPTLVTGGFAFSSIESGYANSCGVINTGAGYCWGLNDAGQIGDGTTTTRTTPTLVFGGLHFRSMSVGRWATCGIENSGAAMCWGSGKFGSTGDGSTSTAPRLKAVVATGGLTYTGIATGDGHTCALSTNGSTYCWGLNSSGQLGDSSTVDRIDPVQVGGVRQFRALTAGSSHTCGFAINSNLAYCWGANDKGQLGDGTNVPQLVPTNTVAGGFITLNTMSSSSDLSCGIANTGVPYCWGSNTDGRYGDGTTSSRLNLVAVDVSKIVF